MRRLMPIIYVGVLFIALIIIAVFLVLSKPSERTISHKYICDNDICTSIILDNVSNNTCYISKDTKKNMIVLSECIKN